MAIYSKTEDAKIAKLYKEGLGVVKISRLLHHDAAHVSRVLRENGVWVRGSRNFTDGEEEQIAKIYQANFSAKAIARAYGLRHHISICAALKRQGVEQRPPPERNRLYALNPHVFDMIDNEEKAYWLGFLYADGCVNRRTVAVSLKDRDHLEKLKKFMQSDSPVKHILARCNGQEYPQHTIEFTDRHLARVVRGLGIRKGRPNHETALKAMPTYLYRHFIRGYWDGDGSVSKNPNSGIGFCGSYPLMVWIRALMSKGAGTNPQSERLETQESKSILSQIQRQETGT